MSGPASKVSIDDLCASSISLSVDKKMVELQLDVRHKNRNTVYIRSNFIDFIHRLKFKTKKFFKEKEDRHNTSPDLASNERLKYKRSCSAFVSLCLF